jgi:hypothetical protein
MRYDPSRATNDWRLAEVVETGSAAHRPCSDAYAAANDEELVHVFSALRLLIASGYPPDKERGNPEIELVKYKCKSDHHKTAFCVLKCKPSGYRLYFHVRDPTKQEAIFLYAVHKKKNKRDDADFDRCCKILRAFEDGKYTLEGLDVPDR